MVLCTWAPQLNFATIPSSICAFVPSRQQKDVQPKHHPTLPFATECYSVICQQSCIRDTQFTTMTPPCHRQAVLLPRYRNIIVPLCRRRTDTSAYLRTLTHLTYFITHLTGVNNTSVVHDIVLRNFIMWSVSKNNY